MSSPQSQSQSQSPRIHRFARQACALAVVAASISSAAAQAAQTAGGAEADAHARHHPAAGGSAHSDAGVSPPQGMTIEIAEPGAEAVFAPGATVPVQVRAEGMSVSGDHWHLYLDGELQAMVGAGRMAYELVLPETLEAGEHELKVTISNARHQEYDLAATRTIRVQASDGSPSASRAE